VLDDVLFLRLTPLLNNSTQSHQKILRITVLDILGSFWIDNQNDKIIAFLEKLINLLKYAILRILANFHVLALDKITFLCYKHTNHEENGDEHQDLLRTEDSLSALLT
jgi:hypothetical protein